jgi:hypothetical protein
MLQAASWVLKEAHFDGLLHRNGRDYRAITSGILEPRKAKSPPEASVARLGAVRDFRDTTHHPARARIGEMPQPEFDRIASGKLGQLVHKTFDGEDVCESAERPKGGKPEGQVGGEFVCHVLRKVVQRDRILRATVVVGQIHVNGRSELWGCRCRTKQIDLPTPAGTLDVGPDRVVNFHSAMRPSRRQADIEIRIGEPSGSQRSSSFRVH